MNVFTLDQARAFVIVAEELHFSRAAERLHMTQPPLSRQIQKLEGALGVRLLLRESRGVRLTGAGEAFLSECRQLLEKADTAPLRARLVEEGKVGLLRIGHTSMASFGVLGELLRRLNDQAPGVQIELQEMVTSRQVEGLRDGTLDIGLARPPLTEESLDSFPVLHESLVVALAEDHPLAQSGEPVAVSDLASEPLIMYSQKEAKYFYDLVASILRFSEEQVTYTVSQALTMITLVATGHGSAVIPASATSFAYPGVSVRALKESPADAVQLHAMWSVESSNPALREAIPVIRAMFDPA